jgi:hypothetical protein
VQAHFIIFKDSLELKIFFFLFALNFKMVEEIEMPAKLLNAPDLSKIMQIISNFGFWKIRLFKKYHVTIFFKTTKWLNNSKWRRPLQFSFLDHNGGQSKMAPSSTFLFLASSFCFFYPIKINEYILEMS